MTPPSSGLLKVSTHCSKRITPAQKKEICEYKEQHPQATQEDIVIHFLKLWRVRLGRSTVGEILRTKVRWMNEEYQNKICLLNSKGDGYMNMERELSEWFTQIRGQGLIVNEGMLLRQGKKLGRKWGLPDFLYSPAWLNRFKKRNGLMTVPIEVENHRVNNKPGNGNSNRECMAAMAKTDHAHVRPKLFGFHLCDVFNFVKTNVAHCAKKVIDKPTIPHKQNGCKDKVTVFLCSNATGAEKLKPLVVGTGPVNFATNPQSDLMVHLDYKVVRNAHMIDSALREWLQDLNIEMHLAERHILLLFDDDTCQYLDLKLSNIELLYVPSYTSCVHCGIMQNFKLHYTNSLLEHFQSSFGSGKEFIVNLVDALRLVKVAWDSVNGGTLEEYLHKVGAKSPDDQETSQELNSNFPKDESEEESQGKKLQYQKSELEEKLEVAIKSSTSDSVKFIWQDVIAHMEDCDQRVQKFCPTDDTAAEVQSALHVHLRLA